MLREDQLGAMTYEELRALDRRIDDAIEARTRRLAELQRNVSFRQLTG